MTVKITAVVLLLLLHLHPGFGDEHSLMFLYTLQSGDSSSSISEFSAVTLLDDTQVDSYSSRDRIRTPKQHWLEKIPERVWTEGTEKLQYDEGWLNDVLHRLVKPFFKSDDPVLQWRLGCEVIKQLNGSETLLNGVNEFGFNGEDLISYNWILNRWSASVQQDSKMEEEWSAGDGRHAVLRSEQCVETLKIYLQFRTNITSTEPDVHLFVKKSVTDWRKLTLTCLATGFYPKDVEMVVRKRTTSLPEHLLTSSGVRPNEDGTFQLRKIVEILEDDEADYDCYVTHTSLREPVIRAWDGKCSDCQSERSRLTAAVTAGVWLVLLLALIFALKKRERIGMGTNGVPNKISNGSLKHHTHASVDFETSDDILANALQENADETTDQPDEQEQISSTS